MDGPVGPTTGTSRSAMAWHIEYRKDAKDYIVWHASSALAIEAACCLIDEGYDVYGIGTGPLANSIGRVEIALICAVWARANSSLGVEPAIGLPEGHAPLPAWLAEERCSRVG